MPEPSLLDNISAALSSRWPDVPMPLIDAAVDCSYVVYFDGPPVKDVRDVVSAFGVSTPHAPHLVTVKRHASLTSLTAELFHQWNGHNNGYLVPLAEAFEGGAFWPGDCQKLIWAAQRSFDEDPKPHHRDLFTALWVVSGVDENTYASGVESRREYGLVRELVEALREYGPSLVSAVSGRT